MALVCPRRLRSEALWGAVPVAIVALIVGQIDGGHPALANLTLDAVAAPSRAAFRRVIGSVMGLSARNPRFFE